MSEIFFTSDSHYAHKNIVRGVSNWSSKSGCRDFDSLEEHNNAIVDGINSTVGERDILYHLGDWSFGGVDKVSEFSNQIKCREIHLIYGNHDGNIRRDRKLRDDHFTSVKDFDTLFIGKQQIVMCHYALQVWENNHRGAIMLHGHSHNSLDHSGDGRILDVCVEGHNYKPWHLDEILEYMFKIDIVAKDHHQ